MGGYCYSHKIIYNYCKIQVMVGLFMSQLFCGTCGTKLSKEDKFCKKCGTRKKEAETQIMKPDVQSVQQPETSAESPESERTISDIIGDKNPDDLLNRNANKIILTPFKVKNDVRKIGFIGLLLPWGIFIILALTYAAFPTPVQEVGMVIAMCVAIVNGIRFLIGSFRFYKVYEVKDGDFFVYAAFNNKGQCYAVYRAAEYTPSPLLKIHPTEEIEKILENQKKKGK